MFTEDKNEGRSRAGQQSSMGGGGNPDKASPAAIERYIKSSHFPASKTDLIKKAKDNNAPSDVLNVLNRLEDKEYNTITDIAKEVSRAT